MIGMFDRYISIDWSGSGTDDRRVNLRVVEANPQNMDGVVVGPPVARIGTRAWTRAECREWLTQALDSNQPRCLVAMDFGFSYPWGTDENVFSCQGWRQMLGEVAEVYIQKGSARRAAESINLQSRFDDHGPYRFDHDRTDFHFYLDNGVAYYRLVEMAIPQAISQWYLGAGAAVGFSSITGMVALDHLITLREHGDVDFQVWPQESLVPETDKHVIVESYPAMYPEPSDFGGCPDNDRDCRDAWKALRWMVQADASGTLEQAFELTPQPFGRAVGVGFEDQVRFEGWILGIMEEV
jgi:hypothetical protein